jgi:lipopolysaccharide export system permease protein
MIFKRIDCHIAWSFLVLFLGSLCLVGSLYAIFDLIKRLEEAQRASMATLAAYYGYLVPVFLVDIVPGLCLVSGGMVLVQMAKRRELLALKASGTSVHRATAPVLALALLVSIGAFAVRETIGPAFTRKQELLGRVLDGKVETQLLLADRQFGREVFVGEYSFAADAMKGVSVMEFHPDGVVKRVIQAPRAVWRPGSKLLLETAEVQEFDASGVPAAKVPPPDTMELETGLKPFDFVEATEQYSDTTSLYHTLPELRRAIQEYPDVPYFRVAYHSRLASLFSPMLLLLVGIPCLIGFERSINSLFLGVIICIAVAAGYYVVTFVLSSMGTAATISALLAGWLPAIIVGSAGLWLYESMLT